MKDHVPWRGGQRSNIGDANRSVFVAADVVEQLARGIGSTDNGEAVAMALAAARIRGMPALDVGVGTGRTVPMMRLLTDDYVAVDYSPRMVDVCRQKYGVDVRVADARDLSQFVDSQFAFVMFSNNGIDALGHGDREIALRELMRVLQPGGVLLFSTLNKDGVSYDERPWQLHRRGERMHFSMRRSLALLVHGRGRATRRFRSHLNWRRQRNAVESHDDWAIGCLAAHEYRLLVHFITARGLSRELAGLGVGVEGVFARSGAVVDLSQELSHADCFHVVARKPSDAALA